MVSQTTSCFPGRPFSLNNSSDYHRSRSIFRFTAFPRARQVPTLLKHLCMQISASRAISIVSRPFATRVNGIKQRAVAFRRVQSYDIRAFTRTYGYGGCIFRRIDRQDPTNRVRQSNE